MIKNLPADSGDAGSVLGSGKYPGGGHGNSLPCSCLENPMEELGRTAELDTTEQLSAHTQPLQYCEVSSSPSMYALLGWLSGEEPT